MCENCCARNFRHAKPSRNPEMDKRLLDILVCPVSKAPLEWHADRHELWCRASRLAYPVRDDIPVMLEDEARPLTEEEVAGSS